MEPPGAVVLATERYGSAQSWTYVGQDGQMERRRDGREGGSRGNSFVGIFKVRIFAQVPGCYPTIIPPRLTSQHLLPERLPASGLSRQRQQRLPAVPVLGYYAGIVL